MQKKCKNRILSYVRHMHTIKPKGLSLDLGFGFWFGYLANFESDDLKYKKKIQFLDMDLSIDLKN